MSQSPLACLYGVLRTVGESRVIKVDRIDILELESLLGEASNLVRNHPYNSALPPGENPGASRYPRRQEHLGAVSRLAILKCPRSPTCSARYRG
jgi:hypothetical protein